MFVCHGGDGFGSSALLKLMESVLDIHRQLFDIDLGQGDPDPVELVKIEDKVYQVFELLIFRLGGQGGKAFYDAIVQLDP